MENKENWKTRTLVIGGVIGLLAGLAAAYILIQRAVAEESRPKMTAGDGVKVGLGVLTVLRTISDLATKK